VGLGGRSSARESERGSQSYVRTPGPIAQNLPRDPAAVGLCAPPCSRDICARLRQVTDVNVALVEHLQTDIWARFLRRSKQPDRREAVIADMSVAHQSSSAGQQHAREPAHALRLSGCSVVALYIPGVGHVVDFVGRAPSRHRDFAATSFQLRPGEMLGLGLGPFARRTVLATEHGAYVIERLRAQARTSPARQSSGSARPHLARRAARGRQNAHYPAPDRLFVVSPSTDERANRAPNMVASSNLQRRPP
jgi:hypothetical protein